eukprot:m.41312 g.41312  ORF g.41312 m.41312 type:complete len:490 (-) comp6117_c0_seq1:168-1637(-)
MCFVFRFLIMCTLCESCHACTDGTRNRNHVCWHNLQPIMAWRPPPTHHDVSDAGANIINRLLMRVIAPLIVVATVGSTVSAAMLAQEGWLLVVWSLVFLIINFTVSSGIAKAVGIPPVFRDEFVMASTFPNALAAPLVMMTTLCRQEPFADQNFAADDGADEIECEEQSLTYLFIYTTGWIIIFFATAYPHVLGPPPSAEPVTWPRAIARRLAGVANVNVLAAVVGIGIGLWPALKDELFTSSGSLLWASSAALTLGGPLVGLSSIIVGATLGQTLRRVWLNYKSRKTIQMSHTLQAPDVYAGGSDSVALTTRGSVTVFEAEATLDDFPEDNPVPVGSSADKGVGAGAGRLDDTSGGGGGGAVDVGPDADAVSAVPPDRPLVRHQAVLVLTRMVLCPLICLVVLRHTVGDMIPSGVTTINGKLLRLLLVLEAVVPSADFVIVLCIQGGRTVAAEALAATFLFEYMLGIVTITIGVAYAMVWIGDNDNNS